MSEDKTPRDHLLEWYDSLDKDIRDEIAVVCLPYVKSLSIMADPPDERIKAFREWMADPMSERRLGFGRVLFAKAIIAFSCMERFTEAGWKKVDERNKSIQEECERDGKDSLAKHIASIRADFPNRMAIWVEVGNSWNKLANTHLNNDAFERWDISDLHEISPTATTVAGKVVR